MIIMQQETHLIALNLKDSDGSAIEFYGYIWDLESPNPNRDSDGDSVIRCRWISIWMADGIWNEQILTVMVMASLMIKTLTR